MVLSESISFWYSVNGFTLYKYRAAAENYYIIDDGLINTILSIPLVHDHGVIKLRLVFLPKT